MGALVKAEQQAIATDHQQYLTFVLGGEMYAIAILSVKEIIDYGHLTVVPMMPECIRGVINLRGAVVPVVDLARRFSSGSTEITRRSCIVIVEVETDGEHQDIGVIVDAVSEVLEIGRDQIEPTPAFGAKIRTDFIQGMGKVEGRFVIVLNVDRVLSMEDLAMLGRAAGQELALQEAV
ncbi:chemotaxis protein CheW [mine drainage metagenome]|uniref:Chemotaxis protein CheW n=1 Tax=mine drainage metagenome TaxID=410659 RepID=A0A1J5RWN1_9ZZZZ